MTNTAPLAAYTAVGCRPTERLAEAAAGCGQVDDADRAGGGGAGDRAGRDLGVVGVERGVAGLRRAAALVADVELVADPDHAARGVADGPALLDGAGRRVDGDHPVLAVDRRVHGGAVGGEHRRGHQRVLGAVRGDGTDTGSARVPSAFTVNFV